MSAFVLALLTVAAWRGPVVPIAPGTDSVVAGVVVDRHAQPIEGARVGVDGGPFVATNAEGRFRLAGLAGDSVTVVIQKVGYVAVRRRLAVGTTTIRIEMYAAAVNLNEVVVTGTSGPAEKRSLGNGISTIDVASVAQTAPVTDMTQLLDGRASGVELQNSGLVGGGARIRIRGLSSFTLTEQPLIYVDGARVDNATGTGPDNQSTGGGVLSRLNDIDPDQIESIEIIKGPAAATLYGTEASNGVVQIITKRGAAGSAPVWGVTVRQGANWVADPAGLIPEAWAQKPGGAPYAVNFVDYADSLHESPFQTGRRQDYHVDVRGGTGTIQYYAGGGLNEDVGAELGNSLRTTDGRSNVTFLPSSTSRVNVSVAYIDGVTNLPPDAGFGGPMYALLTAQPTLIGTTRNGWLFGSPTDWTNAFQFQETVQHFTSSLQASHTPWSWFTHRLTVGLDRSNQQDIRYIPYLPPNLQAVFGPSLGAGGRSVTLEDVQNTTVDYSATATARLGDRNELATSAGFQYYAESDITRVLQGSLFPAPGLTSVAATAEIQVPEDNLVQNNSLGAYLQEQWSLNHRLYVTGAVRVDNNSAFGSHFKAAMYPKVALAWVLSDEPFWHPSWINTFRIRSAYGASGQQPAAFASLRTYVPSVGGGDIPVVTPGAIGNDQLKPERSTELEAGLDAGLLRDRIGVEYTHYAKLTSDALVNAIVSPSTGYAGVEPFNLGRLHNVGDEIVLRATPLQGRETALDLMASLSHNSNHVFAVGNVPFLALNETYGSDIRAVPGLPLGAWFGQKVVSAQFDANGNPINVFCADGKGGRTSCSSAPEVKLGPSLPTYHGSAGPTVTLFRNLRLSALVEWSGGNKTLDADLAFNRCLAYTASSIGTCRQVYFPTQYDPRTIAAIQQGFYTSYALSNAGFTKLREVSASYTWPTLARFIHANAATLTVAARNLLTWTRYSGLDPETTPIANVFNTQTYAALPPPHTFLATLRLTY
jgi:TonB-dependent SusC/RagA subfamily outer membrane receptor